jgi:nucleotide-binding universal stress UspA family protein
VRAAASTLTALANRPRNAATPLRLGDIAPAPQFRAQIAERVLIRLEWLYRVYDTIEQEAVRWPADLIVIGTHGRRGFRRLLLGSVAEGLIRVTTKPVLLVRGGE